MIFGVLAMWAVLSCSVSIVPGSSQQCGSRMLGVAVGVAAFSAPRSSPKRTRSSSSTSSSSSKGPGVRSKKRNNNVGGNQNWYEKRKAGIKVASRGPKPPRWEKEGDNLYKAIIIPNNANVQQTEDGDEQPVSNSRPSQTTATTYEEARALLRPYETQMQTEIETVRDASSTPAPVPDTVATAEDSKEKHTISTTDDDDDDDDGPKSASSVDENENKPFMWGELPVGPVWKSRLVAAGYARPTPIQVASYRTLTSKKNQTSVNGNAILAAPTGSGKSLAYLLPFLTSVQSQTAKKSSSKKRASSAFTNALGRIWIMTPTMELAYQLQRTVDHLVVGTNTNTNTNNFIDSSSSSSPDGPKSSHVLHVVEYDRPSAKSKRTRHYSTSTAPVPFSATYPLLTDFIARQSFHAGGTGSDNNGLDPSTSTSTGRLQEPTFLAGTPKLFLQLRKEIKKTLILDEVDRLLQTTTATTRREYMTTKPVAQELLEALVWESSKRTPAQQNGGRSRSGYRGRPRVATGATPSSSTLQIVCASATVGRALRRQLMYIVRAPSTDKAATLIAADVRTKKDARLRKASLLPSNLKHSYRVLVPVAKTSGGTEPMAEVLVETLRNQASQIPSLVFPGAMGVEAVRESLESAGFADIRGLSDLRDEPTSSSSSAPVYIVKERLARGLDLPQVRTVVLMGVPSNAASYAHLAGRTARQNNPGECITLCWPREAHKLVSIAETLGLNRWKCLNDPPSNNIFDDATEDSENPTEEPWDLSSMTKTAIRNKTVPELRNFLESKGVATEGMRKAALVDTMLLMKED
eukprot:jgi/Psemu1/322865/estExt_fgenesh1_pg.C_440002